LSSGAIVGILPASHGGGPVVLEGQVVTANATPTVVGTSAPIPIPGACTVIASVIAKESVDGLPYQVDWLATYQRKADGTVVPRIGPTPNNEGGGLLGVSAGLVVNNGGAGSGVATVSFVVTGASGVTITWQPLFEAVVV
jgi:hypothetical protein